MATTRCGSACRADWRRRATLPGVEKVRDLGQVQELRMARGCDPHELLRTLVERTRVESFSVIKPSLHDIFVRIAGPAAEEVEHA